MKKVQEKLFDEQPLETESLSLEMAKIVPIRRESAISQFPFHRLSKSKEPMQIALVTEGKRGKVTTTWEVSGNTKYGDPGILAYKLDSLIINRLIDETRPNIPKLLKLGSLRELARELDLGGDTKSVKKALYQNASAFITANLLFQGNDGKERTFEFGATRYKVFFVGDKLPSGRWADAVYVSFDDTFLEMLKQARTRPLDYAYLKALPPAAQRLYELIAPQIFAAIKNGNPRARFVYSDFCMRAPLTRYEEWEQVKKQLYKVHQPHKASGYIAKVEFEETMDSSGRIDWLMWYTPGRKAKAEFRRFNTKEGREIITLRSQRPHIVKVEMLQPVSNKTADTREVEREQKEQALIARLVDAGVTASVACKLVKTNSEECEKQLEALPYRDRVKDKGGYLVRAIREQYAMPSRMEEAKNLEQETREREVRLKEHEEEQARQRAEEMYFQFFKPNFRAYQKAELDHVEKNLPDAFKIFMTWFEERHKKTFRLIKNESRREEIRIANAAEFFSDVRPELGITLMSFEEWDAEHNPDRSDPRDWLNTNPQEIFAELDRRFATNE